MASAKYTVHIPGTDELGQPLKASGAAHHYLTYGKLPFSAVGVQYGHPFDQVTAWGEETPEIDSHMKQLGAYAGEIANHPSVTVTREGKTPAYWEIHNPHYRSGEGAESSVLANEPNIADLSLSQPGGGLGMGHHPAIPVDNPLERPQSLHAALIRQLASR